MAQKNFELLLKKNISFFFSSTVIEYPGVSLKRFRTPLKGINSPKGTNFFYHSNPKSRL